MYCLIIIMLQSVRTLLLVLFVRKDVVNQYLEFADNQGTAAGQRTNHMQAGSQSGRQAGRQADRQADRHAN